MMEDAMVEGQGPNSSEVVSPPGADNNNNDDDNSRRLSHREPQASPPNKSRRIERAEQPSATAAADSNSADISTEHMNSDGKVAVSTAIDGGSRGDDKPRMTRRQRKSEAKKQRKAREFAQAQDRCEYYTDARGLRRVRPYIYDFTTHAKERWLGETVVDVFAKEFGANPRSHYEAVIRCGLLTVNGRKIGTNYRLKNSDLVRNRTHRHEPPVAGGDITIISESPTEIVVDKPCTIPIHPCGSYRYNSLFYILQSQRPDLSLRVCHRLDRLTSGLTILAKTSERAGVIQSQIGTGATRKTYLARVSGKFGANFPRQHQQPGSPPTPSALEQPIADTTDDAGGLWWRYEPLRKGAEPREIATEDGVGKGAAGEGDGAVVQDEGGVGAGRETREETGAEETAAAYAVRVNCPIRVLDPKDGVYECHAEGKESQTVFQRVYYDRASDTSVVECTPVHGRTHQIRLHVQWIGHPIANDPCYGGELYFGDPEAKARAEQDPHFQGWKGTNYTRPSASSDAVGGSDASKTLASDDAAPSPASTLPAAAEDAGAEASPAAVTTEAGVTGASASVNGDEERRRESGKHCGTNADTTVDMNADSRGSATGGIGEDAGPSNQAKGGDHSSGRDSGEGNQAQVGGHRSQDGCADGAGTVTCASGDLAMRGEGVGVEPESSKRGSPALAGEQRIDTGAAVREGSSKSSLSGTSCRSEINMTDKRPGEDDEAFMVRTCKHCQEGEQFRDTQLHCLGIWLHALRYKGPDWMFETKLPSWAIFQ